MAVVTLPIELPTEPTWEELLGSKKWKGLLDPLDLKLRKHIIRCGEFCQVTGDGFNTDTESKNCGKCYFSKESLLEKVYLPFASDYEVVAYLYTTVTSDSCMRDIGLITDLMFRDNKETNWMGYIAVTKDQVCKANGRREIYVAWRGTMRPAEWNIDLDIKLVPATPLLESGSGDDDDDLVVNARSIWDNLSPTPKVSEGWLKIYTTDNPDSEIAKTSARSQLQKKIRELVKRYKEDDDAGISLSLTFTGHSLGGALAALSAFDVAKNVCPSNIPVAAFVFGMPMLGNWAFCNKIKALKNLRILHVKNSYDIVPKLPSWLMGYASSVGTELVVDITKSPYLKYPQDKLEQIAFCHNLEILLHLVAGWNGDDEKFELIKVKRALALINKGGDFLKQINKDVPASWWVVENKGMLVDHENGDHWSLAVPET
uniref:Phospholipase A1 n=1 Tax=Davidia involucrata TaxID=16924 RepID=A0A5B7BAC7_DAVIN